MAWSSMLGDSRLHSARKECGGCIASPQVSKNMPRAGRIVKAESVPHRWADKQEAVWMPP